MKGRVAILAIVWAALPLGSNAAGAVKSAGCDRMPVVQEIQIRKMAINLIRRDMKSLHPAGPIPYFILGIYQCGREAHVEFKYYEESPPNGNAVVINVDTLESRIERGE